jgi:hypothetical protein
MNLGVLVAILICLFVAIYLPDVRRRNGRKSGKRPPASDV